MGENVSLEIAAKAVGAFSTVLFDLTQEVTSTLTAFPTFKELPFDLSFHITRQNTGFRFMAINLVRQIIQIGLTDKKDYYQNLN